MIKKRINTDLFISLSILENNQPADLSTARDLKVFVYDCDKKVEYTYKTNNNIITIQYPKLTNTKLGMYGISVTYYKTSTDSEVGSINYATDFPCAFMIVLYSTEEDNPNVKLTSTVINKI